MSKKKNMATRLWLALFLVLVTFSVSHADYIISNVPERIQEHSMWCWDASSQSMLYYYDHFPTQCTIANWAFSRSDCCGNSTFYWSHSCNTGNYLCSGSRAMDDVLANYGGISSYCVDYPLPQSTVQYEADAHRPFGMRFDWKTGGAHALVGRGYSGGYVYYMDPWPGKGYTFATYASVVEDSTHWWTRTLRLRTPGETNLYNPSGNITDTTPTYSWQKVTDATWYRLYVNRGSTNVYAQWLSSSDYTCSGSTCYYTPTTVLASGDHTWWVQTWNSYGYGPWSNSKSFTVGCTMPGKVSLISPSGSITTSTPTYRWYENGPATWYQLYVYNDTDGRVVKQQWVTESSVCSGGVCSYNPGVALDANDNHRWWIQTWNSCGYGPWSDPLSFKFGKPGIATLISPSGTITTTRPTYTWTAVPSATWYALYVYDYTTSTVKINTWYQASAAGCASGTGNCSLTPAITLNAGSHRWWIKAFNGLYGDWSNSLAFNVSTACGFNEQFNSGNAANWSRYSGSWNVVSSAFYYTPGYSAKWAFSAYNATYSNADYRAKLWRVGTSTYSNTLVARASGAILSDGYPANCYMFQYGSSGQYSVWKRVNGTYITVKYWTSSSYINTGSAWNELRAWVNGTYLWFSINGHYVWSGYDTSLTSGAFGLGMYRGSGGDLYVDWATLTCLSGAAGGEALGNFEISPEQQKLNEAADAQDQTRDATGAQ